MSDLKPGATAPAFTLPDETGKSVSLRDFRGKKVILYFYPKDDTPGCTAQGCDFRDSYAEIESKNAIVIGISPDDAKSHQKFRTKYNLPFILLCDTAHVVAEKYGVWGKKSFMGKEYLGILRSHFVIDEQGKILDAQVEVKAKESRDLAMQVLVN